MTITTERPPTEPRERRRRPSLLWFGGAVAAAILVLAVNGTLSSWTTAIIDNTNNDVAVTGAVALVETGPNGTTTCDTGTSSDNVSTCSSINKYGGTSTALDPDGTNTRTVSVNLKNTGTVAGGLVLSADPCASSSAAGSTGADPSGHPVCDKVTVAVSCSTPATLSTGAAALSDFAGGAVGTLAAGEDTDCVFTLTLPASTPSSYASQVATQVLHWTLTAS
ncbi:hypothetical protein ACVW00_002188 [Marmoricola sp. URHA0025 HA25]